jgi:arginase
MVEYMCVGVRHYIGEYRPERTEVDKIKNSGIVTEIGATWVDVTAHFRANDDPLLVINQVLAQVIADHPERTPLIFAADCVSALGALKGLEPQQPAVLWYDAHGDFNTPATTPSGFLGGMPVAMLVGRGDLRYMQGLGLAPMAEDNIIISDARDLDPEEGPALRASKLVHYPNVDDLLTAPLPDKPLYIHMDIDVVDSNEMPGLGYPVPGGPTTAQVNATLKRVATERSIAGVLFSLWNDSLTTDDRALHYVLSMVRTIVEHERQH